MIPDIASASICAVRTAANRLPRVTLATLRSSIVVIWRLANADCGANEGRGCFRDFGRWYGPLIVSAGSRADIAYVEAVIGRVVALAAHQAPIPLLANSDCVLSHTLSFLTMRGSTQISVPAEAIAVKAGKPDRTSEETCAVEPSRLQGEWQARARRLDRIDGKADTAT